MRSDTGKSFRNFSEYVAPPPAPAAAAALSASSSWAASREHDGGRGWRERKDGGRGWRNERERAAMKSLGSEALPPCDRRGSSRPG